MRLLGSKFRSVVVQFEEMFLLSQYLQSWKFYIEFPGNCFKKHIPVNCFEKHVSTDR